MAANVKPETTYAYNMNYHDVHTVPWFPWISDLWCVSDPFFQEMATPVPMVKSMAVMTRGAPFTLHEFEGETDSLGENEIDIDVTHCGK